VSALGLDGICSERLSSGLTRRFLRVPRELVEILRVLRLASVSSISSTQSNGGGPVTAREDVTSSRTGNGVKFRTRSDVRCRIRC